jgi:hypothetical protein
MKLFAASTAAFREYILGKCHSPFHLHIFNLSENPSVYTLVFRCSFGLSRQYYCGLMCLFFDSKGAEEHGSSLCCRPTARSCFLSIFCLKGEIEGVENSGEVADAGTSFSSDSSNHLHISYSSSCSQLYDVFDWLRRCGSSVDLLDHFWNTCDRRRKSAPQSRLFGF